MLLATMVMIALSACSNSADEDKKEDNSVFLGDKAAPNEMIFIFDYSCPYCSIWMADYLPTVQDEWIDSGKVKFRMISVGFLNEASVRLASLDHNLQKHYPASYFDVAFDILKDSLEEDDQWGTDQYIKIVLDEHELDMDRLNDEVDIDVKTEEIQGKYDIEFVPTVILNGEKVEDPMNLDDVESLLNE